ncbi:sensor histidine kinase [Geodermatophilus sp. SYSU D00684]
MWPSEYDDAAAGLYDEIVRDLYSAGLTVYGVAAGLGPGPFAERLRAATAQLDDAIKRIRLAVLALADRPATDTGRYASRLFDTITAATPGPAAAPTTSVAGPLGDLPEPVVGELLDVVRAVLTHLGGHAGAGAVEVVVTVADGGVTLRVVDGGGGPAALPDDGSLAELHRRASARGGSCVVEPGPAGGTWLTWAVPLR